jgi:hypothetical protein
MAMSAISSGAAVSWPVPAAGVAADPFADPFADPETQRAQVSEQADLLNALRGIGSAGLVANRVSDGKGIDLYL